MEGAVVPALAQEGVSWASSYISAKLQDKVAAAHNLSRLEMALSRLEFVLERTARKPVTHVSLLRRFKMVKRAHAKGTALFNKHRPQPQEQAGSQAATRYLFVGWISRARDLPISRLLGFNKDDHHLSSTAVEAFEWWADQAEKFAADVETGCPLRGDLSRYPFVRQLLEGKSLRYHSAGGSRRICLDMSPVSSGDRGVEAELDYRYKDLKTPENSFKVWLKLRLSESTDIFGIAISCLQLMASQLELAIESAVGELTLLSALHDVSDWYVPPYRGPKDTVQIRICALINALCRPNPTCCNNIVSEVPSSNGFSEAVIGMGFDGWVSTPEYKDAPPLHAQAFFLPHYYQPGMMRWLRPKITRFYGGKEERASSDDMLEMVEMIRSNGLEYLVHDPEPTDYKAYWFSRHGGALVILRKSTYEQDWPNLTAAPRRGRSATKGKRQRLV